MLLHYRTAEEKMKSVLIAALFVLSVSAQSYVDVNTGDDLNACTSGSRCASISRGLQVAVDGSSVIVSGGTYVGVDNTELTWSKRIYQVFVSFKFVCCRSVSYPLKPLFQKFCLSGLFSPVCSFSSQKKREIISEKTNKTSSPSLLTGSFELTLRGFHKFSLAQNVFSNNIHGLHTLQ